MSSRFCFLDFCMFQSICLTFSLSSSTLYGTYSQGILSLHQELRCLQLQTLRISHRSLHARYHPTIQHRSQNTSKRVRNMADIAAIYRTCSIICPPPPPNKHPPLRWPSYCAGFLSCKHAPPPALTQVVHTCALTRSRVRDIHACIRA